MLSPRFAVYLPVPLSPDGLPPTECIYDPVAHNVVLPVGGRHLPSMLHLIDESRYTNHMVSF
jgi:hypothetical protein